MGSRDHTDVENFVELDASSIDLERDEVPAPPELIQLSRSEAQAVLREIQLFSELREPADSGRDKSRRSQEGR